VEIVGDIGAGHTLGRYELLVPIASGGMASVWAARMKGSRGFQKIVAVKVMLAELADDTNFETMFLDEAELASRIKHPNVVEITDLGEQTGVLYQVMEWVDGEPLNHLLRVFKDKSGIPLSLAIRIVVQAAGGLHAAHELRGEDDELVGLVHRDVSPQNLLVTYDGSVKVVDFGVAKATSNNQMTRVGQMKGKVPYMAPEQALGEKVDRRTDVFALGIVLYQLTTGKHPFRGDNDLTTLRRICDRSPVASPRTIVPDFPVALDEAIARALAKDKASRFQSMAEMMRALEVALPSNQRAGAEEVAEFIRANLGERGEKRRAAIREALRIADARASKEEEAAAQSRRSDPQEPSPAPSGEPTSVSSSLPTIPNLDLDTPPDASVPSGVSQSSDVTARMDEGLTPASSSEPGSSEDLEELVQRPDRNSKSVIGALVFAAFVAAVAVGLYLWEAAHRGSMP